MLLTLVGSSLKTTPRRSTAVLMAIVSASYLEHVVPHAPKISLEVPSGKLIHSPYPALTVALNSEPSVIYGSSQVGMLGSFFLPLV